MSFTRVQGIWVGTSDDNYDCLTVTSASLTECVKGLLDMIEENRESEVVLLG